MSINASHKAAEQDKKQRGFSMTVKPNAK